MAPDTILAWEGLPSPSPAFVITQMHRFRLCQDHSGMPRGQNGIFLSVPHCFHPQTLVLLVSIQLVGTMGSSQEEDGPPPSPIIIIITVITVALARKEVRLYRRQPEICTRTRLQLERKTERKEIFNGLLSASVFLAILLNTYRDMESGTSSSIPERPSRTQVKAANLDLLSLPQSDLVLLTFSYVISLLMLRLPSPPQ